ncbi:hypothetical protein DFP72DRAFT_1122130 [Ephemerocybe angulata]|uniref:Uncharacterized protein n=1 Tax=Ephemerocybe angulata TaxID=980116 RepID=A0A8H6I046_9AGAR|nr:hypothetical protein DFP72DRAFT_1122130 [Tulosesus angulatus]
MLSKGDYADGIGGCGIKFAWRLASTTTLATKLCDIILKRNYSGVDVPAELYRWRTVLRSEIARGTSRGRKPALAAKIPDSFPSADIVGQYVSPAVGSSEAPIPNWVVRYPDSARAAHLAAATFQLGWTGTINFLREFVWVGYMLRHFLMGHRSRAETGRSCSDCLGVNMDPHILQFDSGSDVVGLPATDTSCRLRIGIVDTEPAVVAAFRRCNGMESAPDCVRVTGTILMTLPASVVLFAEYATVADYCKQYPLRQVCFRRCCGYLNSLHPPTAHIPNPSDSSEVSDGGEASAPAEVIIVSDSESAREVIIISDSD